MRITEELLLGKGFEKRVIDGQTIYVKGHTALLYLFGTWLPCYYSVNGVLTDRLYVNTIEELELLNF